MKLEDIRVRHQEARLTTSRGQVSVEAVTPQIIRVRYTERKNFSDADSLMVVPQESAGGTLGITEKAEAVTLDTGRLRLKVDRQTCAFSWFDSAGELLVREPAKGGKSLAEKDVEKTVVDEHARITAEESVDGARARLEGARKVVDRQAYSTRLELEFADGEAIYGLGQHEEGILNYRGRMQYLYQQNMKVVAPIIVSSRGYSILWDTYSFATFHDDQHGSYLWTEVDDEMEFYFIYGPEFDSIIGGIRQLTGGVPMLPRWAYGYVQSKERYKTQDELLEVVAEYRRRGIPLDCIVQDWLTWPGDKWGQKSFDAERFPDPDALTDELHRQNVHMMISVWPIMRNEGANQVEMREKGCLLANDATYNAFDPAARSLYWKQAETGLFRHGIDAWWCDCTEPFEADWFGRTKLEPCKRALLNTDECKTYLDPEYINAFSLLHSQGIYEGQRAAAQEKRVVNLTRSGYPGQQRYGAITWSGDIGANWETLRRQIADGLNFTVTGNPRWTCDIGGFFVAPGEEWFRTGEFPAGCEDEGYRELYVRWFQAGVFLPMFRSHGTDTPREIWRFGEPGDRTYDTLVEYDRLRYRLMPYIYSLAARECLHGYTTFRMLAFDFQDDPQALNVSDQFMFGPSLMVCPVTQPMYYGPDSTPLPDPVESRRVYLPAGRDWFDFWSGEKHSGGQFVDAEAPLEKIPLFVPAGSIIPFGPDKQYADEDAGNDIELMVYPGADASFVFYEDAGDGYGYEKGEYATTEITWSETDRKATVGERKGSYPGMPDKLNFNISNPEHR